MIESFSFTDLGMLSNYRVMALGLVLKAGIHALQASF